MTTRLKILLALLAASFIALVLVCGLKNTENKMSDMASTTEDMASTTNGSAKAPVKARATGSATTPKPATGSTGGTAAVPEIQWVFKGQNTGGSASQTSMSVTLVADGNEYDLGSFLGTCKPIEQGKLESANQVSGVQCLVGDTGMEIGVFRSGNSFVVQKGDLKIGDAKNPGKRGPFVTVATLKK